MSMKHKSVLIGFLALTILLGIAIWLSAPTSSIRVSVTLVGYTNDASGNPLFGYASSNVSQSGLEVFRAHNGTRGSFICEVGQIFAQSTGSDEVEIITMGPPRTAATRVATGIRNDFELVPGATVQFAVPAPDLRGMWQCRLSLISFRNYKQRWQYNIAELGMRCGIEWGERSRSVFSDEVVQ